MENLKKPEKGIPETFEELVSDVKLKMYKTAIAILKKVCYNMRSNFYLWRFYQWISYS